MRSPSRHALATALAAALAAPGCALGDALFGDESVWSCDDPLGFGAPTPVPVSDDGIHRLRVLAVATLDGAGTGDDLVVGSDVALHVLRGLGDGSFYEEPDEYALPGAPDSIATGDLDGDGHTDVATVSAGMSMGMVTVWFGDVSALDPARSVTFPVPGAFAVAAADFVPGDSGRAELLVGARDGGVKTTVYAWQTATTTFEPVPSSQKTFPNLQVGSLLLLAAGDFSAGGGPPGFAVASRAEVAVLEGNGTGQFTERYLIGLGDAQATALAVGDFDNVGGRDLAVATMGSQSEPGTTFIVRFDSPDPGVYDLDKIDGSFTAGAAVAGDFEGNGQGDLALGDSWTMGGGRFQVWLGDGQGGVDCKLEHDAGDGSVAAAQAGRFNGDDLVDFAVVSNGLLNLLLSTPPGP